LRANWICPSILAVAKREKSSAKTRSKGLESYGRCKIRIEFENSSGTASALPIPIGAPRAKAIRRITRESDTQVRSADCDPRQIESQRRVGVL
jgi:hypothetical protein